MTPLLIVALPEDQPPIVWWASDQYVIAAISRLDMQDLPFDEACRRYSEMHGEAHFFETQAAAMAWAEGYLGPRNLEVRAEIARAGQTPPPDFALTE